MHGAHTAAMLRPDANGKADHQLLGVDTMHEHPPSTEQAQCPNALVVYPTIVDEVITRAGIDAASIRKAPSIHCCAAHRRSLSGAQQLHAGRWARRTWEERQKKLVAEAPAKKNTRPFEAEGDRVPERVEGFQGFRGLFSLSVSICAGHVSPSNID